MARKTRKQNDRQLLITRAGVWAMLVVVAIAILVIAKLGTRSIFFSSNPHYRLRNIEIEVVKGSYDAEQIRSKLKLEPGVDNIYGIKPGELRQLLLHDPLIQEVEVRRRIPDTIAIRVFGRTPVAQLIRRGGRLVDADAVILGRSEKAELMNLPVVTGVQAVNSYRTGQVLNDNPLLAAALAFLQLKEQTPDGRVIKVNYIQLNPKHKQLRIYLHERPKAFIRDGTVIVFPLKDPDGAMVRLLEILRVRREAQQWTSHVDVTYERRVPVRP